MAVNDQRVRQIIDHVIAQSKSNDDACCGRVRQAWRNLKAWRDLPPAPGSPANSLDLDVAAAENYMFARACVCEGFVSREQMSALALAYFVSKLAGIDKRTSANPQSPPDGGVLRWGTLGAQEGEAGRRRCNPDARPPLWRPISEIMDLGNGYARVAAKPGTRYEPPARPG